MNDQLFLNAKEFFLAKEYVKALDVYETIINNELKNASAYEGAARCLNMLGRYDDASRSSLQATKLDAQLIYPYIVRAYIYLTKNDFQKALHEANVSFQLEPNSADVLECYGTALMYNENFDGGAQYLEESIAINPKSILAHTNIAYIYYRKRNYSKLLNHKQAIFKLKPSISTGAGLLSAFSIRHPYIILIFVGINLYLAYMIKLGFFLFVPQLYIAGMLGNAITAIKMRNWHMLSWLVILLPIIGIPTLYLFSKIFLMR